MEKIDLIEHYVMGCSCCDIVFIAHIDISEFMVLIESEEKIVNSDFDSFFVDYQKGRIYIIGKF